MFAVALVILHRLSHRSSQLVVVFRKSADVFAEGAKNIFSTSFSHPYPLPDALGGLNLHMWTKPMVAACGLNPVSVDVHVA